MRVERVELMLVSVPCKEPFQISSGPVTEREVVLVRVFSEGLYGLGEMPTFSEPIYSHDATLPSLMALERWFVPAILGRELDSPADVGAALSGYRGFPFAKAGLETAVWDLAARRQGVSLARLLGGERERVAAGVSIGLQESIPGLLNRVGEALARGYQRVKLKIRPGFDVEPVTAVRKAFSGVPLMVDANSAYTLRDLPVLRALDELGLTMIEQPLGYDDLVDHARLQACLRTPVCLDESLHTPADLRKAVALGSCRIANVKYARMGGLGPSLETHALARASGIPVWCGSMLELGVGQAVNLALASLPGFTLPGDLAPSDRYTVDDVIDPPIEMASDGTFAVPDGPGIGVELDPRRLGRYLVRRIVLTPQQRVLIPVVHGS